MTLLKSAIVEVTQARRVPLDVLYLEGLVPLHALKRQMKVTFCHVLLSGTSCVRRYLDLNKLLNFAYEIKGKNVPN